MLQVRRISHATLKIPDIERQIEYQVNVLGLSLAERARDRAFMKAVLGQPALVLKRGNAPRCTGLAFQVDPTRSIDEFRNALSDEGIHSEVRNDAVPGVGELLSFKDPQGTALQPL